MIEQIYYAVALTVYSIFIIRFILSWIGADFDVEADVDVSDVVSFKGLTHFLMGFSGWLSVKSYITHNVMWYDYLIALILGVIFVILLYFVYKFLISLETKPQILFGKQLIGKTGKIYVILESKDSIKKYIITVGNGLGTQEYPAKSNNSYKLGDEVVISDYVNAYKKKKKNDNNNINYCRNICTSYNYDNYRTIVTLSQMS